jgi:oligoendopeptidase F
LPGAVKEQKTLTLGVDEARRQIAKLAELGIDFNTITQQLQDDGVVAFTKPFDALRQSIADKKERLVQQSAERRARRAGGREPSAWDIMRSAMR